MAFAVRSQTVGFVAAGKGRNRAAEQNLQLPQSGVASLVEGYRSWWAGVLGPEAINAGLASIAPIAIAVQLCIYIASIPVGAMLRSLELRHLRSDTTAGFIPSTYQAF